MHPLHQFIGRVSPVYETFIREGLPGKFMGVRFTDTICARSKTSRPCVLKHKAASPIGDGIVRHIWGCRRCGDLSYENVSIETVECPLSQSGHHTWITLETISFQQRRQFREITERQRCDCCEVVRDYEFKSMIPFNPHYKKS